jgi:putative endonuclease
MMVDLPQSSTHYVYVVRCANGFLYTGYTKDIEARLAAHNAGKGGRYTRSHRKREALQVEYRIKQLSRQKKLELVQQPEISQWH